VANSTPNSSSSLSPLSHIYALLACIKVAYRAIPDQGTVAIQPRADIHPGEIDVALDLSHAQYIGMLFRTRFCEAQFIVVSLKE
jgi:hypothetical protein